MTGCGGPRAADLRQGPPRRPMTGPAPRSGRERGAGGDSGAARGGAAQRVENECTVVDRYVCPGRSTVDGNDGWFGESGKCWVSRAKASPCR